MPNDNKLTTITEPTKKQRDFAELIFVGTSQADAYAATHDVKEDIAKRTLCTLGHRLFKNPKVQAELKRLRASAVNQPLLDKDTKVSKLLALAERMEREGVNKQGLLLPSAAAAIKSIYELVARLDGDLKSEAEESQESHLTRLQNALMRKNKVIEGEATEVKKSH